jgi:SpoIID/LytB domain protein
MESMKSGDAFGAWISYHAIGAGGNRADAVRAAAAAARQAGLADNAVADYREAVRLDPSDRASRMLAARTLLAARRPEEALAEAGEPASPLFWEALTRAQAFRRLGRPEEALIELDRARAADRALPLAEQERGEIMEALSRQSEAVTAYQAALAIDASQIHLQLRIARLEAALDRTDSAFERYRKYLLVDSSHPGARAGREAMAKVRPALATRERDRATAKELAWQETPAPCYPPLPPSPLTPIAVGIITGVSDFRMKCANAFVVSGADGSRYPVPEQSAVRGEVRDGVLALTWSGGGGEAAFPVRFNPAGGDSTFSVFNVHFEKGYYWSEEENRTYRGAIEVRASGTTMTVINHVPLEEFLLSLVPSEMPSGWPEEALKAQAVAARTETLNKLSRHAADGYNVCASQHCAVYRGSGGEVEGPSRAVLATRGKVLLVEGKPLDTVYAGNCGGWGSSAGEIWGSGSKELPAVCDFSGSAESLCALGTPDPGTRERLLFEWTPAYCNKESDRAAYRWVRSFAREELAGWVARKLKFDGLESITPGSSTSEGWLTSVKLAGASGTREVKKDSIRSVFMNCRSNNFIIERLPAAGTVPETFLLIGAGWGHGAGMCQDGAYGMARAGKDYREILAHYYPGAVLTDLY